MLLKTSCRLTLATDGEAGKEIDVVVAPLTTEGLVMMALVLGEGVIILLVLLLLEPMPEQLSSLVGAVMTV